MAERPHVIVLAGPNGAGKSTAAPALLAGTLHVTEFVNADVLASGLSAFQPETVAIQAGRIMLARLNQLAAAWANFAFETTLASRSFAPWIADLRRTGYECELLFLWLPSPDMAIARVQERVRMGGHDVPRDVIQRRYELGLRNFFTLYQSLADRWRFYDNQGPREPGLLAAGSGRKIEVVADDAKWTAIQRVFANG